MVQLDDEDYNPFDALDNRVKEIEKSKEREEQLKKEFYENREEFLDLDEDEIEEIKKEKEENKENKGDEENKEDENNSLENDSLEIGMSGKGVDEIPSFNNDNDEETAGFSFEDYDLDKLKEEVEKREMEQQRQQQAQSIAHLYNPAYSEEPDPKKIKFVEIPEYDEESEEYEGENFNYSYVDSSDNISLPLGESTDSSFLSLVLTPKLRDLELFIRGLEYVKKIDPSTGKEKIVLRKIKDHVLNEKGINTILSEIKLWTSSEIKLGRRRLKDYYNSVNKIGKSIVRLIYKNLKEFGMDTQQKQRHAKRFCLAIIEMVDASLSRSIEGKENDLSRPTEFRMQENLSESEYERHFRKGEAKI